MNSSQLVEEEEETKDAGDSNAVTPTESENGSNEPSLEGEHFDQQNVTNDDDHNEDDGQRNRDNEERSKFSLFYYLSKKKKVYSTRERTSAYILPEFFQLEQMLFESRLKTHQFNLYPNCY